MTNPIETRDSLGRPALIVLLLGLLLAARPGFAATQIRLAQPLVAMMYAPLYFGVHQGIFSDEGFDLEFMTLRAAAQGFPLKLVFALDHKTPFWLVARPQIKNIRQLAGKKIGVSFPGDTPQIILKRFFASPRDRPRS